MKVMQIIGGIDPLGGGPGISLLLLNKYLNKKGLNSIIFTTNSGYFKNLEVPLKKITDYKNTKVIFYPYPEGNLFKNFFPKLYYSGIFAQELFKGIKENIKKFDLVHIHGIFSFIEINVSILSQKYNKHYIISPRGSLSLELVKRKSRYLKMIYLKLIGKRIFESSSGIHVLTEYEKEEVAKFKFNLKNIYVVPNGIKLSEFDSANEEIFKIFPFLKNKKYILFLSRINWKKGLDILIPAFYEISKIYKDIYLLIAGPDNEGYGEKIKKLIKNYGIEDKVIFTGPLYGKEKISAFKNAEIFVLPSYSENFGLAVLEAMACGKPCVISNKVGIYEEVKKYNAGIIVETNSRSLYNGIQILLKDENLKRKISENAKKIVKNEYDIEKVAEKMIKVYEDILRK